LYEKKLQIGQLKWNLDLMRNVFDQVEAAKKPFLFISSQLAEECDTVYGVTKRLGEVWTQELGGVCIRVWNAYGVMEPLDIKSHVISDFVYQALKTKKIKMMTDGEEWRQFTHIQDLSAAFHAALSLKKGKRTVYDASSYEWVRIIDIANIIADLTGAKVIPGKISGHNPLPSLNMGRVPGWLPRYTLRDGIKEMIDQARKFEDVKKK
jgi:nucleoside-diphosphate-sugar epimerase